MGPNNVFLVMGPQCSGVRLTSNLLLLAGCKGSSDFPQFFDPILNDYRRLIRETKDVENIVLFRNLPYFDKWPIVENILKVFTIIGYTPKLIFTYRDFSLTVKEMVRNGIEPVEAWQTIHKSWKFMFKNIWDYRFHIFNVSVLFKDKKQALVDLAGFTGLKFPLNIELIDDDKLLLEAK
jgi:hypothetical protein